MSKSPDFDSNEVKIVSDARNMKNV